jgi:protein-S-isoprenylcysteine O-methyltransferase Ste14
VRVQWNDSVKKVLAAVLYVVGATCVLFFVYQGYQHPNSVSPGLFYLWAVGVTLVGAAAVLWPKAENEGQRESKDAGEEEETA